MLPCYHIKQKYCIFFSTKAFCDAQKLLKGVWGRGSTSDPAGGAHDAPPDPLVGGGGGHFLPNPHLSRRLWCSELPPKLFSSYGPDIHMSPHSHNPLPYPNSNITWSRLSAKSNRFFHGPDAVLPPNFVKIVCSSFCTILLQNTHRWKEVRN